jgi:Fic family protein
MRWDIDQLQEHLLIGSTLVEGSTLTENEAKQVLAGKTIAGHPISEAQELLNYRASVEWLILQLKKSPFVSMDLILFFHTKLFLGFHGDHGRWKSVQNFTYLSDGNRYDYESPAKTENSMRKWLEKYNLEPKGASAEVVAELYYDFQRIHPFEDGNGRIGRVLIAYYLHWKFKSYLVFRLKDKVEHLKVLESANHGNFKPLAQFFKKRIHSE